MHRIFHIVKSLNQHHIVLTVDEALFLKLMEIKWGVPKYKDVLVPRLGGLHTAVNFHRVLGQHMEDSGLCELWISSGVIGPNAAQQVMAGKAYSRASHIHKLTYQALWRLLLPGLYEYIGTEDTRLQKKLHEAAEKALVDDL